MSSALRIALALALTSSCAPPRGTSPTGTHVTKTGGDQQIGINGQPLRLNPTVLVTNDKGEPAPGFAITWTVTTSLGGMCQPEVSVSDKNGVAICNAWTLGGWGLNQLQAHASGADPVVFSAAAVNDVSDFDIVLQAPGPTISGKTVTVTAKTTDPHPVSTVVANLAGATAGMAAVTTGTESVFTVDFGIDPFQLGETIAVVVHAEDDQHRVAEAAMLAVFDPPPSLLVISPTETLAFSRPLTELSATAFSEADGDLTITASTHGVMLAQGTNILLQQVDLSAFDNQIDAIDFTATDALGASTTMTRSTWVSSNENVQPVAAVEGRLLDFDGQRALHSLDGGLLIANLTDGSDTNIGADVSPVGLSPQGAVSCTQLPFGQGKVTTQGELSFVPRDCNHFDVEGPYLFYTDSNDLPFLADLDRNVLVSASSTMTTGGFSLAPTGDAVFADPMGNIIHATPDGGSMLLPVDSSDGSTRQSPATDGHLIAYSVCHSTGCSSIGVWDGTSEHVISTSGVPTEVRLTDGWLAWTDRSPAGTTELWVEHWPDTPVQRATALNDIALEALLPGGTVVAVGHQQLWRVPFSGEAEPFFSLSSEDQFRVMQRNGHTYFLFDGIGVEVLP